MWLLLHSPPFFPRVLVNCVKTTVGFSVVNYFSMKVTLPESLLQWQVSDAVPDKKWYHSDGVITLVVTGTGQGSISYSVSCRNVSQWLKLGSGLNTLKYPEISLKHTTWRTWKWVCNINSCNPFIQVPTSVPVQVPVIINGNFFSYRLSLEVLL